MSMLTIHEFNYRECSAALICRRNDAAYFVLMCTEFVLGCTALRCRVSIVNCNIATMQVSEPSWFCCVLILIEAATAQ